MAAAVTRHVGLVARLSLGVETGPVGPRRRRTVDERWAPLGGLRESYLAGTPAGEVKGGRLDFNGA